MCKQWSSELVKLKYTGKKCAIVRVISLRREKNKNRLEINVELWKWNSFIFEQWIEVRHFKIKLAYFLVLKFSYWSKHVRAVLDSLFTDISDQGWLCPLKMCFIRTQLMGLKAAVIKWINDLGCAGGLSVYKVIQQI